MTFKESLKWAWSTKPFRYFVIGFIALLTWLIIREINYDNWYGELAQVEEVAIDSLQSN